MIGLGPLTALLLVCAMPCAGAAWEMNIFIGTYRNIWDGTTNAERADMVAERLLAAALEAGFDAALVESCVNRGCMERAVASPEVDLGAVANVAASDASYEVVIELIPNESGEKLSVSGTFDDALDEIEEKATHLLAFAASELSREEKTRPGAQEGAADPSGESSRSIPSFQARDRASPPPKHKRIDRAYFWTAFGVTTGLAAGWGALDIIVHQRYKALEKGTGDMNDWDRSVSLQIAARAVFTAAVTAATATFVMMFFTDFRADDAGDQTVTWAPVPVWGGGAFVLESRF